MGAEFKFRQRSTDQHAAVSTQPSALNATEIWPIVATGCALCSASLVFVRHVVSTGLLDDRSVTLLGRRSRRGGFILMIAKTSLGMRRRRRRRRTTRTMRVATAGRRSGRQALHHQRSPSRLRRLASCKTTRSVSLQRRSLGTGRRCGEPFAQSFGLFIVGRCLCSCQPGPDSSFSLAAAGLHR